MEIPKQLQNNDFRFIKVRAKNKDPVEKQWQTNNNYLWNDPVLHQWISDGNNYGVCGGIGNLLIVDIDNMQLWEIIKDKLPKTFSVRTGSGKMHLYYICFGAKNTKIIDVDRKELISLRYVAQMVVGPGSIHPKTQKPYVVEDDVDIIPIDAEDLWFLKQYGISEVDDKLLNKEEKKLFKVREFIHEKVPLLDVMQKIDYNGEKFNLNTNPTKCLWHEMSGKGNFSFNLKTGMWHCFHDGKGGDVFNLVQENYGYNFKQTVEYFKNIIDIPKKVLGEKKESEEDEDAIHISFVVDEENKVLYEQVKRDNQNLYCRYDSNTKEVTYVHEAIINGVTYKPNSGEEIDKKNIKSLYLPSEATPYENDDELHKEIISFIRKWLDIPEEIERYALWNIKVSWIYDRLHTINYLRALGETGQGKSRFLDTIGALHYKALYTAGSTTSAAIFRLINKWQGTMIIDEADFKKSDESEDIIKIINQGYEKGRPIYRCDELFHDKIKVYDVYGPKILATRKDFQDKATESRCTTYIMTGTNRKDIKFTLNDDFYEESLKIRNKLLMWRFNNYFNINPNKDAPFDISYLEPRLQQTSSCYHHIFTTEKDIVDFKLFLEKLNEKMKQQRLNSAVGEIVQAIHHVFVNKGIKEFGTTELIEEGNLKDFNNIRAMHPRVLLGHLKSLGFDKLEARKINGKSRRIIVATPQKLGELFEKYGLSIDIKTDDENKEFGINTVSFDEKQAY